MPRAYSDAEQARIQATLLAEGRRRFTADGLSDVPVADLCRAADIGKGSFYLFYPSKEALFFAIQEQEEAAHKAEVMGALAMLAGRPPVDVVERYFDMQLTLLTRHPFLRWLTAPGVVEALQRKLPPEVLARHQAGDRAFIEGVARMWSAQGILPPATPPDLLYSLSVAVFALGRARDWLHPDPAQIAQSERWILRALARQLVQPG